MGEIDTQTAALAEKQKQAEEEGHRLADSADGMTKRYLTLRDLQGRKREELSARGADLTAVEESLAQSRERQTQLTQDLQAAQSRCAEAQRALETAQKQLSKAQADITAAQKRLPFAQPHPSGAERGPAEAGHGRRCPARHGQLPPEALSGDGA